MAKKRSAQSKPLKPRNLALETAIDHDAPRRTMRQTIQDLNDFRREWREKYGVKR